MDIDRMLRSTFRQKYDNICTSRVDYRRTIVRQKAMAVAEIVSGGMTKKVAAAFIQQRSAKDVPDQDRTRFIEIVETEVMNLHEGNIARYRLTPSQFKRWCEAWGEL